MPKVPFPRFAREILRLYQPPLRRRSTQAKMEKVLGEFAILPTVKTTYDITPAAIALWIRKHQDRKPITNRSYLGSFRAAVNYGVKMAYIRVSPWSIRTDWIAFDDDEDDDLDERTDRFCSVPEIAALLDHLDAEAIRGGWVEGRLQALVYLYTFTGMRKSEALGLRVEDVHLADHFLRLRGHKARRLKTKSSARRIAIHPELATVLYRWTPRTGSDWLIPALRRRSPWLHGSPGQKPLDHVKAAGTAVGIANLTIQALRRSLATHSRRFGLGPLQVRDLLGHTSETTQAWYLEDDLAGQRAAIGKIDYRAGMGG
jgi:integrase